MGIDPLEGDEEAYFSTWDGYAWTSPLLINPPNQVPDRFPELSVGLDGTLWALWQLADPMRPGTYAGLAARREANG